MKVFWAVILTLVITFFATRAFYRAIEQRDFAATAAVLNKQIGAELPRMCAALGASGKK